MDHETHCVYKVSDFKLPPSRKRQTTLFWKEQISYWRPLEEVEEEGSQLQSARLPQGIAEAMMERTDVWIAIVIIYLEQVKGWSNCRRGLSSCSIALQSLERCIGLESLVGFDETGGHGWIPLVQRSMAQLFFVQAIAQSLEKHHNMAVDVIIKSRIIWSNPT